MSGLYVNSNVSSLIAQNALSRNMNVLSESLTRLSTGLRINSGKDDPSGLIASEILKSDITATKQAITNTERANSMIAIADSALSQVSTLLNDIRGLINEAANDGAMSTEQIQANQLQIDASLDSIDRIARTTNYQGKLLLDGSLDFQTMGLGNQVDDITITSANFGTKDKVNVSIDIVAAAKAAELVFDQGGISEKVILEIGGSRGSTAFSFEAGVSVVDIAESVNLVSDATGVEAIVGADATHGQLVATSAGAENDILFTANEAGAYGGDYSIKFSAGNSTETTVKITPPSAAGSGEIEFFLQMEEWKNPGVTGLSEHTNNIYSSSVKYGTGADDVLYFSSDQGINIHSVEFVKSNPDPAAGFDPTEVAANIRKDGVLEIEYREGATAEDIAKAVSLIKGLTCSIATGTNTNPVTSTGTKNTQPAVVRVDGTTDPPTANPAAATEEEVVSFQFGGTAADKIYLQGENGTSLTLDVATTGDPGSGIEVVRTDDAINIVLENGVTFTGADLLKAINEAGIGVNAKADNGTEDVTASGSVTLADTGVRVSVPATVGNNELDITTMVAGTTYENTDIVFLIDNNLPPGEDVAFSMSNTAQKAAATISQNGVDLKITAKEPGIDFNDVKITMADDPAASDGQVYVFYSHEAKELIIRGDFSGNPNSVSYEQLAAAVTEQSPFRMTVEGAALGDRVDVAFDAPADVYRTGQTADSIGTDHQALIIRVRDDSVTANDVIAAINDSKNSQYAAYFQIKNSAGSSGDGRIFQNGSGNTRVYSGALTGGSNGYQSVVTANELIEFVNNNEELSRILSAENYLGSSGTGYLTVFDEYLRYGDVDAHNAIQFLGPEGSPDIRILAEGTNTELGLVFNGDLVTFPQAHLNAYDVNAAFSVTGLVAGEELNNTVIRFVRLNGNYTADDSYVRYTEGPSNSMAYCSINDDITTTGTINESGKFIVYSTEKSDRYNNVNIVAKLNENQTEQAVAYFNEQTQELIVSVRDKSVTLSEAMDAINRTGLFTTDFDYSFNTTPASGTGDSGPGIETFEYLFTGTKTAVIGNTGQTGGYEGGVIEVAMGGDETEITAAAAIDLINHAQEINGRFVASPYENSDASGILNFRYDNLTTSTDGCDRPYAVPRMIIGGGTIEKGTLDIYLETDEYGNPVTTAQELVDFINSLTAEESRGISASLMYPPGAFTNDICDNNWGDGIVEPTRKEYDICEDDWYYTLSFESYGSNLQPSNAYSDIVAVNGIHASYRLTARMPGPEYEGISLEYVQLEDDEMDEYATFDGERVLVYINKRTTANDVQRAIETSEETRDYFRVIQAGNGEGTVSLRDDSVLTAHGTYEAGYRGGADMLGAADADPNKLTFRSTDVGSDQYVTVIARQGTFNVKNENGEIATVDYGRDTEALLNGKMMVGNGRDISISSSMLSLNLTVKESAKAGDNINFDIVSGGATFQLGPDVVSTQQIRIGIKSINTVTLGGPSGKLYMLRDGEVASLRNDTGLADRIIQEAIGAVTSLRGRLGALQKCTLESNITTLQDTLEALTSAEADISNADFAEETSRMTQAQILVQSAANVLRTANQLPQYAAALLG